MNKILAKLSIRSYISVMLIGEIIIAAAGILSMMSVEEIAIMIIIYAVIVMIAFFIAFKIADEIGSQPGE